MGCAISGLSHNLNDHYPVQNAFLDKHIQLEFKRYAASSRDSNVRELLLDADIDERREIKARTREISEKYDVTFLTALRRAIQENETEQENDIQPINYKLRTISEAEDEEVDRQLAIMAKQFL